MNRMYALIAIAAMVLTIWVYIPWVQRSFPSNPITVCTEPGPAEPIPRIQDHVAAVMASECEPCPTWDALKRAGVEIICANAFGEIPAVNYWPTEVQMGCNRIKEVRITDGRVKVIGGKR